MLTAVISALVIAETTQNSWETQYKATQQDNLKNNIDERKFAIFEEISANMSKQQSLIHSKLLISLAFSIQSYGKSLTTEQNGKLYEKMEKDFPLAYKYADEFDRTSIELNGSFYMAKAMFGPEIDAAIDKYQSSLSRISTEQYIEEYIYERNQIKKPIVGAEQKEVQIEVDSNDFIQLYNPAIIDAREDLIQLMSDEINALEN
ncbi:hypothetical protein [Paenibacillus taichungensis]